MNLKTRALFATGSILLVVLGVNTAINIYYSTSKYRQALVGRTAALAEGIKKDIDKALGFGLALNSLQGMGERLRELTEREKDIAYAMIMDTDGRVLYASNPAFENALREDAATKQALGAAQPLVQSFSDAGGSYHEQVIPLVNPENDPNTTPNYTALSTDIADRAIAGAVRTGSTVYIVDSGEWYIIESDLTLAPYSLPISISGTINIGAVNQGTAGVDSWLVSDTSSMSVVNAGNSTSTPLGVGEVFHGEFAELTQYTNISIMVKTDSDSAVGGLKVHWSTDGASYDETDVFTITANSPKQFAFSVTAKYVHIEYTNGIAPQSSKNGEGRLILPD